jgi:small GTP-binding protein
MNLFNNINKWFNVKIFGESNSSNSKDYKLLVLGDKGVGKTSLCNRFLKNEFNLEVKPTSQSDCFMKELYLLEQVVHLYIIDVNENILSQDRSHFYSNVNGAMILYDITKSKSFEGVEKWIIDLKQNTKGDLPILLVGNKSDLNFLRNVDFEELQQKALSYNCDFSETSCIEEKTVQEAFKLIVAKIYYNEMPNEQKNMFRVKLYQTLNKEEIKENDLNRKESYENFQLNQDEKLNSSPYQKMEVNEENPDGFKKAPSNEN